MTLVYGKIVQILPPDPLRHARVRIGGALAIVTLDLVADADMGDEVLVCDGIAIGKVRDTPAPTAAYVSSHPR